MQQVVLSVLVKHAMMVVVTVSSLSGAMQVCSDNYGFLHHFHTSTQRPRTDSKSSKPSSRSRSRRPPSDDDDDIAALLASDSDEEPVPKSRRSSLARQASSKGRRRRGLFVRDPQGYLVVKQTLDTTLQQLHRMAQDPTSWFPEEATEAPHPLRVMLLRYREAVRFVLCWVVVVVVVVVVVWVLRKIEREWVYVCVYCVLLYRVLLYRVLLYCIVCY